jgi:hypothetical protein
VLAGEDYAPVLEPFVPLLGTPGLRRGSTVVVSSSGVPGVTAVAFGLLAAASAAGRWCALVGVPAAGLLAATELGCALDRLILVPTLSARPAKVVAALLEGCEIVCVAQWSSLTLGEARRLGAVARERRAVLLPLGGVGTAGPRGWPEPADVTLRILFHRPVGVHQGEGRIAARLLGLEAIRRRAAPRVVTDALWLPALDGSVLRETGPS